MHEFASDGPRRRVATSITVYCPIPALIVDNTQIIIKIRKSITTYNHSKVLPGFEPGFQEYQTSIFKILSDNHYTIAPCTGRWVM